MPSNTSRDDLNFRQCVDLLDPHNGIGELCMLDLQETPMSVMLQGKAAENEIRALRVAIENIDEAANMADLNRIRDILHGLRERKHEKLGERIRHRRAYEAATGQGDGVS